MEINLTKQPVLTYNYVMPLNITINITYYSPQTPNAGKRGRSWMDG